MAENEDSNPDFLGCLLLVVPVMLLSLMYLFTLFLPCNWWQGYAEGTDLGEGHI